MPNDPPSEAGQKETAQNEVHLLLHDEFHRRAPCPVSTPSSCHLLIHQINENSFDDVYADLINLCLHFDIDPPQDQMREFFGKAPKCKFKWERHTEFVTYAFYSGPAPKAWLSAVNPTYYRDVILV